MRSAGKCDRSRETDAYREGCSAMGHPRGGLEHYRVKFLMGRRQPTAGRFSSWAASVVYKRQILLRPAGEVTP